MSFRMRSDREGVAIALVAVFIIALLAVLSLGIELGMAYVGKTDAQRVADAAALAGASAFLDFTSPYGAAETEAETRAKEYVGRNVVRARSLDPETESVVHVLPDSQKVRVWVTKGGLPTWTAKLLGFDEITVRAMATAEAIRAGSSSCVKPFALPDRWEEVADDYDSDQVMDFDEEIPCKGQSGCDVNEVWTFDPELGDQYRSIAEDQSNLATATSWGSMWQTGEARDVGSRILISPQYAQDAGTPGWYQYWQMPDADGNTSPGARALTDAIKACVNLDDIGIGDEVSPDGDLDSQAQGQTGNIGKPVYDAVREVLDSEPRPMAWDESTNQPVYTDGQGGDVWGSPRIWTVLLVHPGDIQSGSSHTMEIMDMMTLWLEDPIEVYGKGQPDHHLPITGRMVHWGSGQVGPQKGNLQKVLRLVE